LKFEPGYFINDIPNYTFYIEKKDGDLFENITIFQTISRKNEKIIVAKKGRISSIPNGILLNLENGTIQEKLNETDIHEIYFDSYKVSIPIDNLNLKRRDSKIRGDRELNYFMINEKIESNNSKVLKIKSRVKSRIKKELNKTYSDINNIDDLMISLEDSFISIKDSIRTNFPDKVGKTERILRQVKRGIRSDLALIENYLTTNNKYLVELHKKFSIPFACIVFVLIGMTLGISSKKKGLGMSISLSLIFFVIYWAFLIAGEEFADRGLIAPWLSMWLPNIVLGSLSIFFVHRLNNNKNPLFIDL
jgi:lipopolysaccharide export system permease protein